MIDLATIEIIVLAFYALQLLLITNIVLRLLAVRSFHKFKKYNKAIVIWILSIATLFFLLHLPVIIQYRSIHPH